MRSSGEIVDFCLRPELEDGWMSAVCALGEYHLSTYLVGDQKKLDEVTEIDAKCTPAWNSAYCLARR